MDFTKLNPNSQATWLVDVRRNLIYIDFLLKLFQKILGKNILLLWFYIFKST